MDEQRQLELGPLDYVALISDSLANFSPTDAWLAIGLPGFLLATVTDHLHELDENLIDVLARFC